MNFVDWLVIIAVVYYFLFKVLVDWATVSGAAAAVANNHQQQQQGHLHSNPHQSSSSAGATGAVGSSTSAGNHQQNFLLKPRNNRTPGEGTCYEIGESTVFLLHTYKGKGPTEFSPVHKRKLSSRKIFTSWCSANYNVPTRSVSR